MVQQPLEAMFYDIMQNKSFIKIESCELRNIARIRTFWRVWTHLTNQGWVVHLYVSKLGLHRLR